MNHYKEMTPKWTNKRQRQRNCTTKRILICSRNDRFRNLSLRAHRQVKTDWTTVWWRNLLPAETNIFNVKAVVAVVVEILSVHCGIPHNLHKRKQGENRIWRPVDDWCKVEDCSRASQDSRNREKCTFFGTQPTLTWKTSFRSKWFHLMRRSQNIM